jgi:hypothetical protein
MKLLLLVLSFGVATSALAGPKDIPQNSKLHTALIQLALPSIEREAGQAAKLDGPLSRLGDWVFFAGSVVNTEGDPIAMGAGRNPNTAILWRRVDGQWQMVVYAIGMTDAAYSSWPDQFGAPVALLFPEGEGC